jgi:Endonuclease/Exonuclease/phosphatase family
MQGNARWDGQVREVVPAIMRSILDEENGPVHAVSLNEVCRQQFRALKRRLGDHPDWPMHGRFLVTDPRGGGDGPHCQGPDHEGRGHDYGIAVFTRRPITNVQSWPLPHPASGETRKLLCVTTTLAGRPRTKVCTTHITNGEGKGDQIRKVRRHVNRFVRAGRPVILMGDFNVEPDTRALDGLYSKRLYGGDATGRFREVDGVPPCRCGDVTHSQGKIDYMFLNTGKWRRIGGKATHSDVSDHVPLRGWARAER